jgi:hypothetical protein
MTARQPTGKTRSRSAAESKPEVMDNVIEPSGSPCPWGQQIAVKTLSEDTTTTEHGMAEEPPRHNQQANRATCDGQIG